MQSDFRIETHTAGRVTTLALRGELDLVSSPALDRTVAELTHSDAQLIVIDLRGLEFMDSTGLHVLVQAQQQAHDTGRRLVLIRGREQVQRLFDLTGLADALAIVDSPEQLPEFDQAHGAT